MGVGYIAGMVLGIIGLVFAFIPAFGAFIAFPCIIVGLPLSGVGFFQGKKRGTGVGISVAGIVTNIVALIIAILWLAVIGAALSS